MRCRALLPALAVACVDAWRSEGTLPASSSFASYIGKFCFDYKRPDRAGIFNEQPSAARAGIIDVTVAGGLEERTAGTSQTSHRGRLYFAIYDDERSHWKRARPFWDELSCEERLALASSSFAVDGRVLDAGGSWNQTIRVDEHIRPRFWYFTFVNCGAKITETLSYSVHAVNIWQGFQAEFGMDVRGSLMLEFLGALLFSATAAGVLAMGPTRALPLQGGRLPPLLRLLGLSAVLSASGCGFHLLHHLAFAGDGRGLLPAAVLGTFFNGAAKAVLTVLVFLIAKGWALLLTPEERVQRNVIVGTLAVVIGLSVCCEAWEQYFHDQGTSLHLYESWTGWLLLGLNNVLLVIALVLMYNTYAREAHSDVRKFYSLVAMACGIYAISLTVVCILAELLDPWVRRKYVERTEVGTRLGSTLLLLLALRPSHLDGLVSARLKNQQKRELLEVHVGEDEEAG